MIVTLAVVAVLVIVGTVAAVVVWQQRGDDAPTAGQGQTTEPPDSASASDEPGPATSTAPTSEATPSETPPTGALEPDDGFDRDPLPSPEPAPEPELSGKPLSHREFARDWDYRLGDVELQAAYQDGTDHAGCGPVESDRALTRLGCVDAVEWTYRALGGKLALSHLVLTMRSPAAADRAVDRSRITEESWRLRPSSYLADSAGAWRVASVGQFVVLTVETHRSSVPAKRASTFLLNANLDVRGALGFRF